MRRLAGASLAIALQAGAAWAADADARPPVFSWAGLYFGANLGGAVPLHPGETLQAASGLLGAQYDLHPPSRERAGVTFGANVGYNFQWRSWVYGAETELNFLDGRRGPAGTFPAPPAYAPMGVGSYTLTPNTDGTYFASFRGRLGYAVDRALVYGTFGVASGGWRGASMLTLNGGGPGNPFTSGLSASSRMKYVAGAGVEYALDNHWSARAEYLFLDQSLGTQVFDNGNMYDFVSKARSDSHLFRVGLMYNLGASNVLPKVSSAKDKAKDGKEKESKDEGKARDKDKDQDKSSAEKSTDKSKDKDQDKSADKSSEKDKGKDGGEPSAGKTTSWPNVAETSAGNVTSTASESAKINPTTATDTGDVELYSAHGQVTVLPQGYPKLRALYTGPYSLPPNGQVHATVSTTGFVGLRLWQGGEAYVNPEIDEGYGLADTLGVAGFPSAEAYKVGHARPYLRFQRFFMRQTIGLGGDSETIDPGQNLLGGPVDANRLTFTVGKYSVVDIFDDNRYAHDTRNGFINWSVIDMGAFDYAADSWGYTYGATAEWKQDSWTARAGYFQLSVIPNDETIERVIGRQWMGVAEFEGRHKLLFDQPGKVKLLFYADTGYMGKYDDALYIAAATDSTPDVTQYRLKRTKAGGGLNIEQPITDDFGLFLRGSLLNGRYETFEFTDIQRSISGGGVLTGAAWERPKDAIGAAFVVNGLSGNQVKYFSAGGLGVLIGDGALSYNGEHILETYYKYNLAEGVYITGDYQFVHNPAYNKDRGPANIFALRLHGEF